MSKKTKVILIIAGISLILCFCSCICLSGAYYFFSSIYKQGNEIKGGILTDICQTHGDFSIIEYKAWFTEGYRSSIDYNQAKEIIEDAFPESFDCDELVTDNVIDLYTNRHSINISSETGRTIAEISFPKDEDEVVTFILIKVGDEWEIDSVSVTRFSG